MQSPYARAAEFFGRAFNEQERASAYQEYDNDINASRPVNDVRLQNPTIGSVPPSVFGAPQQEDDADSFMTGVKDSLLEQAREKKRPSNGRMQLRASGGVNTAV
jgi:hypothetical protein